MCTSNTLIRALKHQTRKGIKLQNLNKKKTHEYKQKKT